jgi:hypothetical protein
MIQDVDPEHPIDVPNWYAMMTTAGNADFATLVQDVVDSKQNRLDCANTLNALQLLMDAIEKNLSDGMSIDIDPGLFYFNILNSGKTIELVFCPKKELLKSVFAKALYEQI